MVHLVTSSSRFCNAISEKLQKALLHLPCLPLFQGRTFWKWRRKDFLSFKAFDTGHCRHFGFSLPHISLLLSKFVIFERYHFWFSVHWLQRWGKALVLYITGPTEVTELGCRCSGALFSTSARLPSWYYPNRNLSISLYWSWKSRPATNHFLNPLSRCISLVRWWRACFGSFTHLMTSVCGACHPPPSSAPSTEGENSAPGCVFTPTHTQQHLALQGARSNLLLLWICPGCKGWR